MLKNKWIQWEPHQNFGKKKKAIRGELQSEDDPQMLPHTSISIVKDNECIGINFCGYVARIIKSTSQ